MGNPFDAGYFGSDELRDIGFRSIGQGVRISKACNIVGLENITIGDHVRIDAFTSIIATGPLSLGSHIHVGTSCLLGSRGDMEIGDYCAISHGVRLFTASDDFSGRYMGSCEVPSEYVNPLVAPLRLKGHNIVGANTVVLPAVEFGIGAAVGAQSLVTRDIPAWEVHAGSPATKRSERSRAMLDLIGPRGLAASA